MSDPTPAGTGRPWWRGLPVRMRRAWSEQVHGRRRYVSAFVLLMAAALITVSARVAGGHDLRPARNSDLIGLVESQGQHNRDLAAQAQHLQSDVRQLTGSAAPAPPDPRMSAAAVAAGTVAVTGPGVRVTLNDAPLSVQPVGVDPDLLVVHQQDIQTFTNLLWRAGAEAMSIQGVRIGSTSSIKCVGNTVIVGGVPYAPPYVIEAIGDQRAMLNALATDPGAVIYRQYVTAYGLGYTQQGVGTLKLPAWNGPAALTYATPMP